MQDSIPVNFVPLHYNHGKVLSKTPHYNQSIPSWGLLNFGTKEKLLELNPGE